MRRPAGRSTQHALELEREYGLRYASDTRGGAAFLPLLADGPSTCPQLPTTLPTFDELLGRDGIDEATIADAVFRLSRCESAPPLQVFTLHAELEGMLLRDAFESLLVKWRNAGASITRMAAIHALADPATHCRLAPCHGRGPGTLGRARRSGSGHGCLT